MVDLAGCSLQAIRGIHCRRVAFPSTSQCGRMTLARVVGFGGPPRLRGWLGVVKPRIVRSSASAGQRESQVPREILSVALPTTLSLAIEPLAALISTAFVGHLGPPELAGVGISLTLYNSFTKLFNMPLLAIITTYMASAPSSSPKGDGLQSVLKVCVPLIFVVGLVQTMTLALLLYSGTGLRAYGLAAESAAYVPAHAYLTVRVAGNLISVAFFAMLGVFRGLQDTVSPLMATILFTTSSVCLEYVFLFRCGAGTAGAAAAVILAQCFGVVFQMLLLKKHHRVDWGKVMGGIGDVGDVGDIASNLSLCGILMCRTSLVMLVYSSATSLVASSGIPAISAAHQIAFQVWLASSLLADSLAVAAQSLMAKSMSAESMSAESMSAESMSAESMSAESMSAELVRTKTTSAMEIGRLCLRYAFVLGSVLTVLMHFGMPRILGVFTASPEVLMALSTIKEYVVLSQVVSSVAFVLDGIVYSFGSPGYKHALLSMACSASVSLASMWGGSYLFGLEPLTAAWIGLVALMVTRALTLSLFTRRCWTT